MRFRRPSAAMCVACVALFVSLGGSSVAAISFAQNAGAVDGKSAVYSGATLNQAAGKLVATNRKGADKGRLPSKFLAGVGHASMFALATQVNDNAAGAPQNLGAAGGLGRLTATCNDQNPAAGTEDPTTTVGFTNTSAGTVNFARRVGVGDGAVGAVAPQTVTGLGIGGSNTFSFELQAGSQDVLVSGTVRQDGRATPAATCLIWGTITTVG
jgi:hypothetical protein